jgi:AraC-like DNA-binding protein
VDSLAEFERTVFQVDIHRIQCSLGLDDRLLRVWSLIQASYDDPELSLAAAARYCGMSQNNLNRVLRFYSGWSFHQLLTRYRVFQAAQMFVAKNYTVSEVALANGFNSPDILTRNFKRCANITPKHFQQRYRMMNALFLSNEIAQKRAG